VGGAKDIRSRALPAPASFLKERSKELSRKLRFRERYRKVLPESGEGLMGGRRNIRSRALPAPASFFQERSEELSPETSFPGKIS
jgi:hypothetical protein